MSGWLQDERKERRREGKRQTGNRVSVTVGRFSEGFKVYRLVCLPTVLRIDMSMFLPFVFVIVRPGEEERCHDEGTGARSVNAVPSRREISDSVLRELARK